MRHQRLLGLWLDQAIVALMASVQHIDLIGPGVAEDIKVVTEQIHLQDGLIE